MRFEARGRRRTTSTSCRLMRRAISTGMAMLLTLCLANSTSNVSAEGAVAREYEIKAAYLYNFIKYIDWPAQGLPTGSDTITIGVIGGNPFGPALAPLDGKMVKGRKLVIKEAVR